MDGGEREVRKGGGRRKEWGRKGRREEKWRCKEGGGGRKGKVS